MLIGFALELLKVDSSRGSRSWPPKCYRYNPKGSTWTSNKTEEAGLSKSPR